MAVRKAWPLRGEPVKIPGKLPPARNAAGGPGKVRANHLPGTVTGGLLKVPVKRPRRGPISVPRRRNSRPSRSNRHR
ncbi:hypothetical protein [Cohnella sp. GCM10012308]|uniref:hypothetical protein n=1 Tax=Cohnella sp. GCM10012308 TaxID=3317329 RepID=UPI00360B474A